MSIIFYQETVSTANLVHTFTSQQVLMDQQLKKTHFLNAMSASLQAFSHQPSPSDWALKLKYRRPPTSPACCFLCKWCCEFKHLFIPNPYFISPEINLVIFWQQGRQHSRGMPVAESAFDPSSQPHTWVMMAVLVALSPCTPSLSLHIPPMNAVIDEQRRHPCLICL